jgi:hypothetical protein
MAMRMTEPPRTPARFTGPWAPKPMSMNRKRVIVWMTIAVAFMLAVPMSAIFGGIPPWPIVTWFVASHVVFCTIIMRVKPYTGPYVEPMIDPELEPRA